MQSVITIKIIAISAAFTWATASLAHVSLETANVETSSTTKATLRVGHGCEGLPTAVLRVLVPEGFAGAKPMPKPGWTLATMRAKLAKPYDHNGTAVTEDVSEITWTANSKVVYLRDDQYDEFVLRGKTPAAAGPLWFKVTQLCKEGDKAGQNPWVEVPATGTVTKDLKFPAALMNVSAPGSAAPEVHKH